MSRAAAGGAGGRAAGSCGSAAGTGALALHVCLAAAGLAAAGLIARAPEVSPAERNTFELAGRLPRGAAPALWLVMQAGSLPAVYVAAGLALAARRPRLAADLAASGTAAWVAAKLVKPVVHRGRPAQLLPDVAVYGRPQSGLGFPSGHAAVAAAMMTAASPHLPPAARAAGWAAVGVVATARMYVGAHLPLDVAGGLLLGWTVGSAVRLAPHAPPGLAASVLLRDHQGGGYARVGHSVRVDTLALHLRG